ncbi:hypothetical protein LTR78_009139 [Recurvomyces mirabilis]|uniref:Uncharacterized protein n=2 Tax=Recurvomyces mirabilis TaxID=574656 RepID=A0AAE0TS84_9PEZI|nr:hypothetical protein LTR78_009139 [Recurvomyces mirabilis]
MQQSPTASTTSARLSSDGQQMYGFQQGAPYGASPSVQTYAQSPQTQVSQRQAQTPQYQSYGPNLMYGMAAPQNQQQPAGSVYEQVPQFRQRPAAPSETLGSQFGVPQSNQYYLAAPAGSTSAPAPDLAAQQMASQYQTAAYPQPVSSLPTAYPGSMMDPAQSAAYASYQQQQQQQQQHQQQAQQYAQPQRQEAQAVDQGFNDYQSRVRTVFTLAQEGSLGDIGQHLLHISQYLLGNCEALGLTRDDEALHDERIRLWDEFNRAWLVTLQRQLDMTEEIACTQQAYRNPQSIMSHQSLDHLSRELIRLCDSVERHGLVDYQMGVAEEEIVNLILRCLALLETIEGPGEARQAESSAAGASRAR